MKSVSRFLFLSIFFIPTSQATSAERAALVVGNAQYRSFGYLRNPANDARSVRDALQRLQFDVIYLEDAGREDFNNALATFSRVSAGSKLAVVYYAGHGVEFGGKNFLIPVDARASTNADIEAGAIALDDMLSSMTGAQNLRLILLDACRDNPLAAAGAANDESGQGLTRGLAPAQSSAVLVSYAASAGTKALDGMGDHSPYTQALLEYIERPDLEIADLFRKVAIDVKEKTSGKQIPFEYGRLPAEEVYLHPQPLRMADRFEKELTVEAREEWVLLKNTTSIHALEAFIEKHSANPLYLALAKARLDQVGAVSRTVPRRIALSIGVDDYADAPRLIKAVGDSRAMEGILQGLNFDVISLANPTKDALDKALNDFKKRADDAELAGVFFSGHTVEISGKNYLLPVDVKVDGETELAKSGVLLEDVVQAVNGAGTKKFIMVDGGRTDPFSNGQQDRRDSIPDIVSSHENLLISFSSSSGGAAFDGEGAHSVYIETLMDHFRDSNLTLTKLFNSVGKDVAVKTNKQQIPKLYFTPSEADVTLTYAD